MHARGTCIHLLSLADLHRLTHSLRGLVTVCVTALQTVQVDKRWTVYKGTALRDVDSKPCLVKLSLYLVKSQSIDHLMSTLLMFCV